MITLIRKRLTFANVAMTLACVFAMTGGAYAAKRYFITSTKQISPKVLKQLKGATGPEGKAGAQGPAGKDGTTGTNGTNGKDGSNGKDGVSVASSEEPAGANCKSGGSKFVAANGTTYACNGENGQTGFTSSLPSGKSLRGTWTFGKTTGTPEQVQVSISFGIPLATPLTGAHVFFVTKEEEKNQTVPAACGGTQTEPQATKGNLCVYGVAEHAGTQLEPFFLNPEASGNPIGAGVSGAVLYFESPPEGSIGRGSWVVTAP